jgi:hypothetical protein
VLYVCHHRPGNGYVAAVALSLGNCTVVTDDTDLSAVSALAVEDWTV